MRAGPLLLHITLNIPRLAVRAFKMVQKMLRVIPPSNGLLGDGEWGVAWDMILQSQLSSKTAATPSPQAGGFFPIVFAAASVTDPNRVV